MELAVCRAHCRVLAHHEEPLHPAVAHPEHRAVRRMIACDARQVVVAVVVVGGRSVSPVRLQQARHVRVHVAPETDAGRMLLEIVRDALVRRLRHRQVAGKQVVERRDVRRSLNGRVAAQGEDAAAGATDVAEKLLDDGGGTDVLHPDRVLGPADRVTEGRGAIGARVVAQRLAHLEESSQRHAAHLLDNLGRVPAVVPLEDLEHAAGMLQRRVGLGGACRPTGSHGSRGSRRSRHRFVDVHADRRRLLLDTAVLPGAVVVLRAARVPAREQTVQVLGVAEVLADDRGRVRVPHHVVAELAAVLEDVVDDPAEEGDVVPGSERNVHVGDRARPGEAGIDVDDRRAAQLRLHDPLEAHRVALGHVRAHDHDAVGVLQILLERRGAAATEGCPQTGDGGGVSYAGLVLDLDRTERGEELLDEVVLFVVEGGPAEDGRTRGCGGAGRPCSSRSCQPSRRASITRSAIMSIAVSSESSSQRVLCGRRYLTLVLRDRGLSRVVSSPSPSGRGGHARSDCRDHPRSE